MSEIYYSIARLGCMLDFAPSTIRTWCKRGMFGPACAFLRIGLEVRIPHSGYAFFCANHLETERSKVGDDVRGRSLGEARRRARAMALNGSPTL